VVVGERRFVVDVNAQHSIDEAATMAALFTDAFTTHLPRESASDTWL
jgi:hypothetical protein